MKSRISLLLVLTAAASWWSAAPAWSQAVQQGNFDINIGGGVILHENASALQSISPNLYLKARIFATENIGVGFSMNYSRTKTDDDVFPLGQFDFGTADSTTFRTMQQPVSLFMYQVLGTLGTTAGSLYPYLQVGLGGYTIYLDPQQNEGAIRETDLMLSFGGAVKFNLSGSSSIELSAFDYIWTGFDREALNPTLDRTCRESGFNQFRGTVCPNERFPYLNPTPPEEKSTIHNIVISATFGFIPRL